MAGSVKVVLKSVFDDKGIRQAQQEFAKVGKTIGIATAAVAASIAVAGAAAIRFGQDSIKAAESVATANARLDAINKSMGLFGSQTANVTNRLIAFAESNELVVATDAEVIKATQAKLLTFAELAKTADSTGGAFDRATVAAIDLAAAGFGSAETNAIQLGKALQDPIKGLTALGRSGVTFTNQEKENIKVLVQSGQVLEAQNLILSAIEKQVGGTAAATANASDKMALAFENIQESVGAALLPTFNEFTDTIIELVPEISRGLVPIAENLAEIFKSEVTPAIKEFTEWLASSEGNQKVKELTEAILDGVEGFVNFTTSVIENWEAIKNTAIAIGVFLGVMAAIRTALTLATAAQMLFNAAVLLNPYVAAAVALSAIAAGLVLVYNETKRTTDELEIQRKAIVANENAFVTAATNGASAYKGLIPGLEYTTEKTEEAGVAFTNSLGEANRFNALSLANARKEVELTTGTLEFAARRAKSFSDSYAYLVSIGAVTPQTTSPQTPVVSGGGGAGSSSKETPAEAAKKRFAAVQKVIVDAQKKIAQAEQRYAAERFEINKRYEENVADLRKRAAESQMSIVMQSMKRLTDVFRNATQGAIGSLFNSQTVREISRSVKQVTSALTVTTTKETERLVAGSVDQVIEQLRAKISNARNLIANATSLASLGFSQTFIEQVIETGAETGNELAKAILEASPETQAELKRLFLDLESVSETGMNALSKKIYDEQGLATRELKALYTQVQAELNDALIAEQQRLSVALVSAGASFQLAIKDIKDAFLADLAQFDGAFAGLGKTIDQLLAKLNALGAGAVTDVQRALTAPGGALAGAQVIQNVAFKDLAPLKAVSGLVVDSLSDVAGTAAYLQERIKAAERFAGNITDPKQAASALAKATEWTKELNNLSGSSAAGGAVGTVININVKTDTTQSQAMVGRTIGSVVTKYVQTGGQVLVSGQG